MSLKPADIEVKFTDESEDDGSSKYKWTLSAMGRYSSNFTIEATVVIDLMRTDDSADGIELTMYGLKESYRDFHRSELDFDFPEIEGHMLNYIHEIREETALRENKLKEMASPAHNKRIRRLSV